MRDFSLIVTVTLEHFKCIHILCILILRSVYFISLKRSPPPPSLCHAIICCRRFAKNRCSAQSHTGNPQAALSADQWAHLCWKALVLNWPWCCCSTSSTNHLIIGAPSLQRTLFAWRTWVYYVWDCENHNLSYVICHKKHWRPQRLSWNSATGYRIV